MGIRAVSMLARDPLGQAARYSTARVIVQRLRTLRIAQMLVTRYLHLLAAYKKTAELSIQEQIKAAKARTANANQGIDDVKAKMAKLQADMKKAGMEAKGAAEANKAEKERNDAETAAKA